MLNRLPINFFYVCLRKQTPGVKHPGTVLFCLTRCAVSGISQTEKNRPRVFVGVHFLMRLVGFDPFVVNINTLVIAMPVATYGTILCLKYGKDTTMITEVTFITTLVSMVSIPLLVTLLF